MRLNVVGYEDEALIWLVGSLDVHTVGDVRERLWGLLSEGFTKIVIDASCLTSMDRVGLDVLDAVSGLVVDRRGHFVVRSPSEEVGDFLARAPLPATITLVP